MGVGVRRCVPCLFTLNAPYILGHAFAGLRSCAHGYNRYMQVCTEKFPVLGDVRRCAQMYTMHSLVCCSCNEHKSQHLRIRIDRVAADEGRYEPVCASVLLRL